MRRVCVALAVVTVLAGGVARAQDQHGSIEGAIKDPSGSMLPDARIEARSPSLVGVAATVTDANGTYRLPFLPPGRYTVVASLSGFRTGEVREVRLELGQALKVDFMLAVAGVAETVSVSGQAPIIDVRQNAAGTTVPREIIDRVPQGRDALPLVTSAPGINQEVRNFGIQIDGASGADNRFLVDGVDTTNLLWGTSGKPLVPDFAQEVQAKASGYSAEHRAAIGGVVNAVSRSGGNTWHGSAGYYFTSDELQGDVRPFLRLNPSNQTIAEYVTFPVDDVVSPELVFDLGGPIRRDRIWFYLGYDRQATRTRRTVTFRDNGQRATFESTPVDATFQYSLSARFTDTLRGRLAASNERVQGGVSLPFAQPDGTSTSNSSLFPGQTRTDLFNDPFSVVLDWVANSRTYINLTTGLYRWGGHNVGSFSEAVQHRFVGSNFQFPDIPASLQKVDGYTDAPSSARFVQDHLSRFTVNADLTRYQTWHGQHVLKAGVQIERVANQLNDGQQAPAVQLFWDASLATSDGERVRGTYGYYTVSRFSSEGDVHAGNIGLFVQDSWTLADSLTLNLGLRTEREHVPSYRPEYPGVQFGFADKLAPRVGAAYDVGGAGRWKVYGSWGVFYDLMKLTMSRVMFGANHWIEYRYTLDAYDWPAIQCPGPPSGSPRCPGTFIEPFDYLGPPSNDPSHNLVDPALAPTRSQEATVGVDHALSSTMSLGIRYAHKWVDRAIEAVGFIVPGTGEEFWVANPGFGQGEFPLGRDLPRQPRAERVYDGLEVRLRRRLADRWSLDTSYLWSRLWGNWSGIATSDEAVRGLQPNSGRIFDLLYYSYDANGHPTLGPLGTDRPHQLKLQATYDFPWGTMIGANYLLQSGIPSSTVMAQKGIGFYPYGRGNLGRTPTFSQLDVLLQHQFRLPGDTRLSIGANAMNLFDQETTTRYATSPYRDQFNVSDTVFFGGFDPVAVAAARRFRPDARFGQASTFQGARAIRMQAKFTF